MNTGGRSDGDVARVSGNASRARRRLSNSGGVARHRGRLKGQILQSWRLRNPYASAMTSWIESWLDELVQDSGGAGAWRGGLGLRRIYRPIGHVVNFSGQGERCVNALRGVFGCGPGARPPRDAIRRSSTASARLPRRLPVVCGASAPPTASAVSSRRRCSRPGGLRA